MAGIGNKTFLWRRTLLRGGVWVLPLVMVVWGCYPKRIGPEGADGHRLTWIEMTIEQRKAHMQRVVLPGVADIFRTWRPERFATATVRCNLCHGKGARIDSFAMPSAKLPRLSGEVLLGPELTVHPDTTRLKLDQLVPFMATALGKRTFNVVTRRGFGCYSCHLGPSGPMFGN